MSTGETTKRQRKKGLRTRQERLERATTLLLPMAENANLRHPLTILVAVVPAACIAELFRFLAPLDEQLLTDAALLSLTQQLGIHIPILMPASVLVGCLGLQLLSKRKWIWPRLDTLGVLLAWAAVWSVVRLVLGITTGVVSADAIATVDPTQQLLDNRPDRELSLLNIMGLAMSGALHEEVLFRALGIGGMAWLLRACGLRWLWAQLLMLAPSALLFALAHTAVINHAEFAPAFNWPLLIQHSVAGLLYGVIFIRQGLGVAVWSHCLYNCLLGAGLTEW